MKPILDLGVSNFDCICFGVGEPAGGNGGTRGGSRCGCGYAGGNGALCKKSFYSRQSNKNGFCNPVVIGGFWGKGFLVVWIKRTEPGVSGSRFVICRDFDPTHPLRNRWR